MAGMAAIKATCGGWAGGWLRGVSGGWEGGKAQQWGSGGAGGWMVAQGGATPLKMLRSSQLKLQPGNTPLYLMLFLLVILQIIIFLKILFTAQNVAI